MAAAALHPGDAYWMRRALRLARRRAGRTWPNPTVGACIVRDGRLLAEAVHERAGGPHAEAAALSDLRQRGIDPEGATVYVTLEPCDHHGRTPPCSHALIEARVGRVVHAVADLSARGHEGGARRLREHGIEVEAGLLAGPAWELNHPFFETSADTEIHLTVKVALSLDGRFAPRTGRVEDPSRRTVTGPRARRRVHRMRARASAVMVGSGTVEADRPRLDVRGVDDGDRLPGDPRPVVLDSRGRLDPAWLPDHALLFCGPEGSSAASAAGVEVVPVDRTGPGRLNWEAILPALAERGLGTVLVEAGPTLAADLLATGRAHRFHLFLAPRILGPDGPGLVAPTALEERYRSWRSRRVGEDLEWILRRHDLPMPPG
ncbi:MAG TPA: bifunctional diaminohydroxyphosphoribosylaminopyrimidine deaminase/5-amino-6-(5-phosphoribosylamino)uracil reductase RibD [Candidatus Krumholzibacteria bacterium]|nr:bifunctional diaminohydroxyphosphoribosylaminopyrimidine deaminase/5-amino-6-(5-phosphoribosylamino)uracil reductase RibD [Candidatus Krumholzibacteria bacterium]